MTSSEFRRVLAAVRSYAREHHLLAPGPLVVAVSGGTDSVALLALLAELADETGAVLHVAHFDHRTRPRASAADAAFVADLAARFGAAIRVGRASAKPTSEDAARRARYAFLRRVASDLGANAIATGHTRDDQAETVLLHLTRGAGLVGLAGMRPSREGLVRPLLAIDRADTVAVCRELGIAPREDPSNRSLRFARNRIRHRVLPELARVNPAVTHALARLATTAAAAIDDRARRAEALLDEALVGTTIDLDRLGPDADLRGEALALAWRGATGRVLSERHRAALDREAARRDGTRAVDLPGGMAVREYATLRLAAERLADPTEEAPVPLMPHRPVDWRGWTLQLVPASAEADDWPYRASAGGAADFIVRARRPGDRLGSGAKVQDLFVDAKIPARLRAIHPIVATADDRVWWVPGLGAHLDGGNGPVLVARPPASEEANGFWASRAASTERQVASSSNARKDGQA